MKRNDAPSDDSAAALELKQLQTANEELKARLKGMEEQYLTGEEKERKRRLELDALRDAEKKDLQTRAESWEKRYRQMFLEKSLIEAVEHAAAAQGLKPKDVQAIKGLLLSDSFPAARCRLSAGPPREGESEMAIEVRMELQEADENGRPTLRPYPLDKGLDKFFRLCPWLLESNPRRGAGLKPGLNYPPVGEIKDRITELKERVQKNPHDRVSRIRLLQLLALKQRQQP